MLTAIYSLSRVQGAEGLLLFWLLGAAAYVGLCAATGRNKRNALIALLAAEAVVDLMWARYYYPDGAYLNHGLAGAYAALLWIPVLAAAFLAVTLLERRKDGGGDRSSYGRSGKGRVSRASHASSLLRRRMRRNKRSRRRSSRKHPR